MHRSFLGSSDAPQRGRPVWHISGGQFLHCVHPVRSLKSGQAGLVISNARVQFDDVTISGEGIPNGGPGKARPVDIKQKLVTTWANIKRANSN